MQKDSIRENLTKEDIIATLELELNADVNREQCFVLVEGSDDVTWGKRIFEKDVIVYESFSGKAGLRELLDEPSIQDNRVIAIRDKDYMDVKALPERMFVYDFCCLEMMLLSNREVLEGFCQVYCGINEDYDRFLNNILRDLAPYSLARKMNEEKNLRIKFDKGFGDLVTEKGHFPIDNLFFRTKISDDLRDLCKVNAESLSIEELYDITNGHDLCMYLGVTTIRQKGKKLGEADVRNVLIGSYRRVDFEKTKLYRSICEYQADCGLKYINCVEATAAEEKKDAL